MDIKNKSAAEATATDNDENVLHNTSRYGGYLYCTTEQGRERKDQEKSSWWRFRFGIMHQKA